MFVLAFYGEYFLPEYSKPSDLCQPAPEFAISKKRNSHTLLPVPGQSAPRSRSQKGTPFFFLF